MPITQHGFETPSKDIIVEDSTGTGRGIVGLAATSEYTEIYMDEDNTAAIDLGGANTFTKISGTTINGEQHADFSVPSISAATIAYVDSNPDTITDSGSGFLTAGFVPGMRILTSGSGAGNDGTYTIASVTAGTITLISTDAINAAEGVGPTITIVSDGGRIVYSEDETHRALVNCSLSGSLAGGQNGRLLTYAIGLGGKVSMTASTISFADDNPDTINDSGNGFITAGFTAGMKVVVSGAANAGNNTTFTIASVAAGALTLVAEDAIVVEGTGASITLAGIDILARSKIDRYIATGADVGAVNLTCFVQLAQNAFIEIYCNSDNANDDLTVSRMDLNIHTL